MSATIIIGVRIDRFANARRAIRQCSALEPPTGRSSQRTSSADCITSTGVQHDGPHFCALQLAWNPDTIVSIDKGVVDQVRKAPGWADTAAVRGNRVYLSPSLPYGWIDSPPSLNRLIGLKWLARLFFPDRFSKTLSETTREFYARYYQVDLTDAQLGQLLTPPPSGP